MFSLTHLFGSTKKIRRYILLQSLSLPRLLQGTFLVGEQLCRRFTAAICMIQKNIINILLRLIYWLSAYEKWALWLKKCTIATMQCNTSQISPACQTCIKPILLIWPYSIFFEIVKQLCRRLAAFTCVLPKNVNNIFFAPVSQEFAQEKSTF